MSWNDTAYLRFADAVQARSVLESALGPLPAGNEMTAGTHDYSLVAPVIEWVIRPTFSVVGGLPVMTNPGQQRSGYWAMVRLSPEGSVFAKAATTFAPFSQAINNPNNVLSGDAGDVAEEAGKSFISTVISAVISAVKSFFAPDPVG